MSRTSKTLKAIPQTTLRRLRNTPSYFFLVWRWTMWIFALAEFLQSPGGVKIAPLLLGVTLAQTLVATLYAPVFQVFLPELPWLRKRRVQQRRRQGLGSGQRSMMRGRHPDYADHNEEIDVLTPLVRTSNPYWDIIIYSIDVLICGLVMYFGGPWGGPFYGYSSPFYRYGFSAVFAAALAYGYRGGFAAALGYELFVVLGILFPAPGAPPHLIVQVSDLLGSLIDVPLAALLAAYLTTLLRNYTRSRRREQEHARRRRSLLSVSETLLQGASDQQQLLQQSAEQIRKGGHFGRLAIALLEGGNESEGDQAQPGIETYIEVGLVDAVAPEENRALLEQVARSGEKLATFKPLNDEANVETGGIARLYMPFFKEGQIYMIFGAESRRQTPFDQRQEDFLSIVGAQLLVALENMRLTEQTAELAAAAERGRIAREIHDGIAQLIYMLSLNSETCMALAQRIEEASSEDAELLHPLTERLKKLVTISKQALWETRHYMFTLKPLMSGSTTLTQMLSNQLREFEAISGLSTRFEVEGSEETGNGNRRHTHSTAQVGTAIFRITQEALTNAYKHADATLVEVRLRYLQDGIEVEICDNGKGLEVFSSHSYDFSAGGELQRVYSGHGIRGMRERTEELCGTFEMRQAAQGGVSIRVYIPG